MMNFLVVLISSFLYAAAFPKWNFWFLSFIALVPFFVVLDQRRSMLRQAGHGMLWGAGMSIGMGYWLFPTLTHHYEVPFFRSVMFFTLCLVIPIGMIYAVFALIYRFLRQDRFFFYGFVVPALWALLEYVKESLSFLIPWGGIAVALVPFSPFIQAADIIGPYGVVFLAVMVNALCFWFIKGRRREKTEMAESFSRRSRILAFMAHETLPLILIFLLIAVPSVYGLYRANILNTWISLEKETGSMVPVTLVQGNFSTKERWSGMGFLQRTLSYLEMSKNGADGGPRVIVWPETTLNSAKEVNDAFFLKLMRAIGEDALLISGGLNTDNLDKDVYNCIYFISGNGSLSRYDKHYLLPYTETSPFFDLLDRYYQAPDAFAAGRTAVTVETPEGLAGASVCMEILYSNFIRRSVKNGAGYLVNVSNDSWFGDSAMPYIHLNAARLRAIENRRFVLRASNSGISAVISPTGQIMDESGLFTKERVDGEFIQTNSLSVYSRYGDVMLYGAVMVLIAAFVQVIIRKPAQGF